MISENDSRQGKLSKNIFLKNLKFLKKVLNIQLMT